MNRRGFLSSLAALATTAVMPDVPTIPIKRLMAPETIKVLLNAVYGKTLESIYRGGRVLYMDTDGVIMTDIRSAYPEVNPRINHG